MATHPNAKFEELTEQEILRQYRDGAASTALADKYDCSTQTILNIVRRNDGQVRNQSESLDQSGENNPYWNGGEYISSEGYRLVKRPDHPNARESGYILEHRLVATEMLDRPLQEDEIVHHKNEDKLDNRPENLKVFGDYGSEHSSYHARQARPNETPEVVCTSCQEEREHYAHDLCQTCYHRLHRRHNSPNSNLHDPDECPFCG
jgi:hypothetical protein